MFSPLSREYFFSHSRSYRPRVTSPPQNSLLYSTTLKINLFEPTGISHKRNLSHASNSSAYEQHHQEEEEVPPLAL